MKYNSLGCKHTWAQCTGRACTRMLEYLWLNNNVYQNCHCSTLSPPFTPTSLLPPLIMYIDHRWEWRLHHQQDSTCHLLFSHSLSSWCPWHCHICSSMRPPLSINLLILPRVYKLLFDHFYPYLYLLLILHYTHNYILPFSELSKLASASRELDRGVHVLELLELYICACARPSGAQ